MVFPLINIMEDMNGRITDLMEQMHLQSRIYHGNVELLFEPVDWSFAEECIKRNRMIVDGLVKSLNL